MLIKDFHKSERPRERMLRDGAESLSNQELLAIILRTGTKSESVVQLGSHLLEKFEGLRGMRSATFEELMEVKGIGPAKAAQLFAAIELGRRFGQLQLEQGLSVKHPGDVAEYLMAEMRFLPQEHFVVLFLNSRNQVIHKQSVFIGSLTDSIVHPREVFREAVRRKANSFICAHNHPSGNPEPSKADIDVTKRLAECGKIMGIELIDHVVIGDNNYVSMRLAGVLDSV